uniref:BBSome-interacting protein 1 n=1 Tax=Eptatretus burgeri TaxID=7764 RepID=A0A8C4WVU1_EPTBU
MCRVSKNSVPETSSFTMPMVILRTGELYTEIKPSLVLCKPKVLPLKSVTLEKLERMQRELQEAVRAQQATAKKRYRTVWHDI